MNLMDEEALMKRICEMTMRDRGEITRETPLLSSGFIDSAALLEMVSFIEEKCSIKVKPNDMTLKNFNTVLDMMRFLDSK